MTKTTIEETSANRTVLVELADGEYCPAAGSTQKVWAGPGAFKRVEWRDGGRDDYAIAGGARLGYW